MALKYLLNSLHITLLSTIFWLSMTMEGFISFLCLPRISLIACHIFFAIMLIFSYFVAIVEVFSRINNSL